MRYARLGLILPLLVVAHFARPQPPAAPAGERAPVIRAQARAAGFTFAAGVTAAHQAAILGAVAGARPEAQRLVEVVDGLTTVHVGATGDGAAGTATDFGDRYEVRLDLGAVGAMGPRAVARLVLHELGHVVDYALVSDELLVQLNASIPEGWVCEQGSVGSCAVEEERFAETFAKWATGDIGVDVHLGYKVPPPSIPLGDWGAPLGALGS